ncbi:MAG: hypothetical protein A2Z35_01055 [Actinobacteria bacterium RBG_19FT_COMBO_36_27]|nr:MAG: hypothetical protein A2Z35_01055 [Actinobacteria bacterium RBG_19FT_COMBO_36_27]
MKSERKISIVTGAAKGIGKATSIKLAEKGFTVILADIDKIGLEKAVKDIKKSGIFAEALILDIANVEQINRTISYIIEKYKRIDVLVNNAGIFSNTPILEMTEKEWNKVLNVNLKGTFFLSKAVLPIMMEQRYGKIINMSSLSAKRGGSTSGVNYGASKAGVISITKYLAKFCAPYRININAVVPGFVDTDMIKMHTSDIDKLIESIPLGYIAKCEEIANVISFLVSEDSSYITGEILDVNGGVLMD